MTKYRADINGLRAIAVLAVVANHVGLPGIPAGFFGVDVFFVISGFLISGIILTEIKSDRFSIGAFYERRIRRILPALVAVFLATLCLAYKYFLPVEAKNFALSLLAATFCVSNVYFWGQSGYFQALAAEKPLLHTWSLAVEEQFYFVFPLFLLLCSRLFRKRLHAIIVALFVGALLVGALGAVYRPIASFYLAPTRAWQLLMGTILALDILRPIRRKALRNILGLTGMGLIIGAMIGFSADSAYPGLASVLPCLGSALIIYSGRVGDSWVSTTLSTKPMVFIGLISYSLYLWHWPLIVFHRVGMLAIDGLPPLLDKILVIIASIAIATLSWKYVETPFRSKRIVAKSLYRYAALAVCVVVAAAVGLLATNGLPDRYPPPVAQIASFLEYDPTAVSREGSCFMASTSHITHMQYDATLCLHEETGKKNYLLIGDSHAAHLWYGLKTALPNVNIMQATSAGCKPTVDIGAGEGEQCRKLIDFVYNEYLPEHKVDAILVEAIWRDEDMALIPHTLEFLKRHADKVVLFGPMVQYDTGLPRILALALMQKDPSYAYSHRLAFLEAVDDKMAAIASQHSVEYASFFKILCEGGQCETTVGDSRIPLLYDYGHLTTEGSMRVVAQLRDSGELTE